MLKKILAAVLCTFMLLGTVAFATVAFAADEIKAGDTAYVVYDGTVMVT